jgi:hypothetical protein
MCKENGPFSYHLDAVFSRSHKALLSFVKKLRQEIYGKSDWPLTSFFTIWEGPPARNNQTFCPIRVWHCNISGSLGGRTLIHLDSAIVARVGRIDRSHPGTISFGVVGPKRAKPLSDRVRPVNRIGR